MAEPQNIRRPDFLPERWKGCTAAIVGKVKGTCLSILARCIDMHAAEVLISADPDVR